MELYPLKFQPLYYYRIWGGNKLKSVLNKDIDKGNIGESWEISSIKNNETKVKNGKLKGKSLTDLINTYKESIIGKSVYKNFGNQFPLLIKFIDAKTPLSIQVHPSNELALKRHQSFGKNEMWYVMDSDSNAELIVGFNQKLNKESYKKAINEGKIVNILNTERVKKGDVFNIPTGRVHAIGAGVLLAEIQQTSDITYRIFDYNRIDSKTGSLRELHTDLALDAIDFELVDDYKTEYSLEKNKSNKLVETPYFKTNIIELNTNIEKDYSHLDSFIIYMCVEGNLELEYKNEKFDLNKGETIFIPACINKLNLSSSNATILEVYL